MILQKQIQNILFNKKLQLYSLQFYDWVVILRRFCEILDFTTVRPKILVLEQKVTICKVFLYDKVTIPFKFAILRGKNI